MTVVIAAHADHILESSEIYWVSEVPQIVTGPRNEWLEAVIAMLQARPGHTALIDSVQEPKHRGTVPLVKSLQRFGCEATQRKNRGTNLVDVYASWPHTNTAG